jgi:hypothetical protein
MMKIDGEKVVRLEASKAPAAAFALAQPKQ